MKITHISALAALVVMSQVAFAQAPATTTTTTTSAATGDPGTVSNVGSITASNSTSTTDTLPSDNTTDPSLNAAPKGELANTGGEPQIMLMAGLVLAACGLLFRRKMAGQAV